MSKPSLDVVHKTRDVSSELRNFTNGSLARRPILRFIESAADVLPPGARILDAGAGHQPYRELFAHCEYLASDWAGSVYDAHLDADIVAPLHDLPIGDRVLDAVLCTQVLEHVPNPREALAEISRVLKPGGKLFLTAPLSWPLHEEPYDFYRYTNHGLREIVAGAGLEVESIDGSTSYFTTVAILLEAAPSVLGWGWSLPEKLLRKLVLPLVVRVLPLLDRFDRRRSFPSDFLCVAVKPPER
jgi:SAM-dependent methyltransferase